MGHPDLYQYTSGELYYAGANCPHRFLLSSLPSSPLPSSLPPTLIPCPCRPHPFLLLFLLQLYLPYSLSPIPITSMLSTILASLPYPPPPLIALQEHFFSIHCFPNRSPSISSCLLHPSLSYLILTPLSPFICTFHTPIFRQFYFPLPIPPCTFPSRPPLPPTQFSSFCRVYHTPSSVPNCLPLTFPTPNIITCPFIPSF